jgi:hypothetical protein
MNGPAVGTIRGIVDGIQDVESVFSFFGQSLDFFHVFGVRLNSKPKTIQGFSIQSLKDNQSGKRRHGLVASGAVHVLQLATFRGAFGEDPLRGFGGLLSYELRAHLG